MQHRCLTCGQPFTITTEDLAFYDHMSPVFNEVKCSIPPPTRCPECRLQRRLAFRNHTAVFQRPASPDGKMIFSMHPQSAPFPVIRNEDWMGDKWNPLATGRPFSFNRHFMDQFAELNAVAPKYARIVLRCENCDYCNNLSDNRNCYMVFSMSNSDGSMFCEDSYWTKDCLECTRTMHSERCYDCVDCLRCYDLQSSEACENCSNSSFLTYCRSCRDCFGCVNLRSRQYCVWNEQKTPEEYHAFLRAFHGQSFREREAMREKFAQEVLMHPRPHATFHMSENCTGNYITESKNVHESSFIVEGENLKYCFYLVENVHDCMDFSLTGRNAELIYESCTCVINVSRLRFCMQCRNGCNDLFYCYGCDACQNCFGCSGLYRQQYCIFNQQYTKEEYDRMVPQIIEHMRKTNEWGEFFGISLSPMPYNRTLAQRYFPLEKEEALRRGYLWEEEDPKDFPDAIDARLLPDSITEEQKPFIVRSLLSGRPFRITTQEIKRCHELSVPLPRLTYQERMDERARKLGGIRLYECACARTGKSVMTTYPTDSPYIIWDRDEYMREFE